MNSSKTCWMIGLVALAAAFGTASSQTTVPGFTGTNYDPPTPQWKGQAGMTFLQIGGSARAEGMAGACNGVKGDPSLIFYNPAGMASLGRFGLYANQTNWIADMTVSHLVAAGRVGPIVLGGTFVNMDYGDIPGTQIVSNTVDQRGYTSTGNLSPATWSAGVFAAVQLTDRFSTGVHVKYVTQDFSPSRIYSFAANNYLATENRNKVGVYAVDMGTQYVTGLRNIALNMSLQNFASPQKFVEMKFDLPVTYRVGLSAEAFELATGQSFGSNKLNVYVDGLDQKDVALDMAVGAEYMADLSQFVPGVQLGLRAGRRAARNQDGWMSYGGSVEFGMSSYAARFDYSYSDYGAGLPASRVGLSITMN